jgi:hypothetical protein
VVLKPGLGELERWAQQPAPWEVCVASWMFGVADLLESVYEVALTVRFCAMQSSIVVRAADALPFPRNGLQPVPWACVVPTLRKFVAALSGGRRRGRGGVCDRWGWDDRSVFRRRDAGSG